jgi:hypothetical protein
MGEVKAKYYYIDGPNVAPPKTVVGLDGAIGENGFNPILRFDKSLIDNFQAVSPTELGESVPYVSLRTVDLHGNVLEDLSMNFFHAPVDMEKIKEGKRYGERPVMSLKELSLKTTLAGGVLDYTSVTLLVKIHSPSILKTSTAVSFLIPGAPLLLEYGRKGTLRGREGKTSSEFLNQKEQLLFQVKSYNLSMDALGQIDLTVEGTAFNDTFNNVYVGDTGLPSDTENLDQSQSENLKMLYDRQEVISKYMTELLDEKNKGSIDYDLISKWLTESQEIAAFKVRNTPIHRKFVTSHVEVLGRVSFNKMFGKKHPHQQVVKLHDLLYTYCHDTFGALAKTFPGIAKFSVVYGNFNDRAGPALGGKSIAEFPIHKRRFDKMLQKMKKGGQLVPTLSVFLNYVEAEFLEDKNYWTWLLSPKEREIYNHPNIKIHLENKGSELVLNIIDLKSDIPPTTGVLPIGKSPEAKVEKEVKDLGIPIIRFGHANSFIKSLVLNQHADQAMKAALIERMWNSRIEGPRSLVPPAESRETTGTTPLTLPLKGTASVLGHVAWKPYRTFYLAGGIYVVNGFYKITGVTHKLSAAGFNTNIDFMYH